MFCSRVNKRGTILNHHEGKKPTENIRPIEAHSLQKDRVGEFSKAEEKTILRK